MRSFTEGTGFELSHVVDNFPWGDLGKGTVVDVSSKLFLLRQRCLLQVKLELLWNTV